MSVGEANGFPYTPCGQRARVVAQRAWLQRSDFPCPLALLDQFPEFARLA